MSEQIENRINKLLADPRLNELLEMTKSGSDAFYLVSPLENQNSDILAWCFNPREGHDQGDLVLKDFLTEIYSKAEAGDCLGGWRVSKKHTKSFVVDWTPSRIAASSFGAAFCLREYYLPSGGRIDLMIVEPHHKFILIVENKVGDKLKEQQLAKYSDELSNMFGDYQKAFIALDYYHDQNDENNKDAANRKWVALGYEWLVKTGRRAEQAIRRGNTAASLLKAYCEMLTSGEYYGKEARGLIHSLAHDFQDVFQELKPLRLKKGGKQEEIQANFWKALNKADPSAYLLRMYQQNPYLWDQMIELSPVDHLDYKIRNALDYLADKNCNLYRGYACYLTRGVDSIPLNSNRDWPVYIVAGCVISKSAAEPKYYARVIVIQSNFHSEEQKNKSLEKLFAAFPGRKIKLDTQLNCIGECKNLDQAGAVQAVLALEEKLRKAFLD